MAHGAVWMVLFKFVERGIGLVSTLILARLLSPGDFGLVAMAMSFIVMSELLGAFGFDVAIIHDRAPTRADYDSAWTCNVLLGLAITTLMVVSASPIAAFYGRPELTWVIVALAFGPLLAAAENIGVVAFRKELDFRREFRFQVSRKLAGFFTVVPLAFLLRNHWALVAGILFSKFSGLVISYKMHPYRPRPSLERLRALFRFSRWLLLTNVITFARDRGSDFLIGRLAGAPALGTYNVAFELANLPTSEISAPINRALMPGFAMMDADEKVAQAYAGAVRVLALLALPLASALFALAPYLVALLLGPKWLEAIGLMQVLAFNGALMLLQSSVNSTLFGRGYPARVAFTNACHAALLMASMAFVLIGRPEWGMLGAAYAALATSLAIAPIHLYQIRHCLGVSPLIFLGAMARPAVGGAAMILAVWFLVPRFEPTMGPLAVAGLLAAGMATAAVAGVGVIFLLWRLAGSPAGAERLVIDSVRTQWKRRFGAPAAGGA